MKRQLAMLGTVLFFLGLIAGCNRNDVTGPGSMSQTAVTTDQAAAKVNAVADPFVQSEELTFTDDSYESEDYSTGSFGKVDTAVIPIRYGRFINHVDTTITVTMPYLGDSASALVSIAKDIYGDFAILAKYNVTDTAFTLVQKPFHDRSVRNVILKKKSGVISLLDRWVVAGATFVDGGTVPPNDNIHLTKLQLFLPSGDSVSVTNPDTTFLRYAWMNMFHGGIKDVPELRGGDPVRLQATVVSKDSTGDIVALRFGLDKLDRLRAHLDLISEVDNGDGTWTRIYQTPTASARRVYMHFRLGYFDLGVDAVTKSTVDDSSAPYSASWWGIPYRVF